MCHCVVEANKYLSQSPQQCNPYVDNGVSTLLIIEAYGKHLMRIHFAVLLLVFGVQIRLVEGRDRPIDRLAKNVLLFGERGEGEDEVS